MSDLGSIGILAALLYLFAVFCAFIKGSIEQMRKNKKPKTSDSKHIFSDKKDELNLENSEGEGLFFGDPLFPPEFEED